MFLGVVGRLSMNNQFHNMVLKGVPFSITKCVHKCMPH